VPVGLSSIAFCAFCSASSMRSRKARWLAYGVKGNAIGTPFTVSEGGSYGGVGGGGAGIVRKDGRPSAARPPGPKADIVPGPREQGVAEVCEAASAEGMPALPAHPGGVREKRARGGFESG
jgi:hypothetical protein